MLEGKMVKIMYVDRLTTRLNNCLKFLGVFELDAFPGLPDGLFTNQKSQFG
jgi:hypothetical protein